MGDLSKKKLARIFWLMGLNKKQMLSVTHFGWENSKNKKSENPNFLGKMTQYDTWNL